MKTMTMQPYAAFVGIDWADTKHDVCIQSANSLRREFAIIPHKVEEIDEWAQSLHRRFSGIPGAIHLHSSGSAFFLYCCWQTKTQYDEATYLKALQRRGSPLVAKAD